MRVVLDTEQTAVCKFIVRVTCEIVRRFFVKSDRLLVIARISRDGTNPITRSVLARIDGLYGKITGVNIV